MKNWTFENETLAQDISAFEKQIDAALVDAKESIFDEIIILLHQHIEVDVYRAYTPKRYLRRRDNPELGESLIEFSSNTDRIETANSIGLEYLPDGEHPQFDRPLHGDDLIRRIEQGGRWEWKTKTMRKRPFLKNAVSEIIEGGKADRWLVEALRTSNPGLTVEYDHNIQRESTDWVF